MNTFRYGNLSDEDVLADHFTQYNLSASKAREAFARVAKQLIAEGRDEEAMEALDRGLQVLPSPKIRYTDANTYPFIEGYYALGEWEKGDKLLTDYANVLIEYIEYYLLFDGYMANMVAGEVRDKMDSLSELYYLAGFTKRNDIIMWLNDYYRTFGYTDEELISPTQGVDERLDSPKVDM
jgi:hypothetical protein